MSPLPLLLPMGLYGIADAAFGEPVRLGTALYEGGCRVVQLRCKDWSSARRLEAAVALTRQADALGALLIINDDLETALRSGAHGLHLGQEDGPLAEARAALGPRRLIGRSTHSLSQVESANYEGANYIGFGPVFPTESKTDADPVVGLCALTDAVGRSRCPVVAIGGITEARLDQIRERRPHGWAVISDLLRHGQASTQRLRDAVPRFC